MSPIITLISDWRIRDPYLAIFKGKLLSVIPDANILDITHHVEEFSISQTAILMKQCFHHFPEGTIHLLLTNVSATSNFQPVVVEHQNHYFIGEDNGIFQLMFGRSADGIQGRKDGNDTQTPSLMKMIALAQSIVEHTLDRCTSAYTEFTRKLGKEAINNLFESKIEGEIIYIDAFCNAITNIPVQLFDEIAKDKDFTAIISSRTPWKTQLYNDKYLKIEDIFLTKNDLGLIEIAMFKGKVSTLASMEIGDKVEICY